MGVEHQPLHQGSEAVEGPPGGEDQQLRQTGHVPAYLQPTLACWFVLLRLEETVWLCSRQTIPATPEAPHLTGRVGGPPPGEAGGLQVSSALTPVAAVVIILTGRPRSPPLSMREVMVAQLAVLGFDITTQFLLSSDWIGASPSWSVLTCPHLLSPSSSLCPPLSRHVLLPASRLWASSWVSTPSPPSSCPGWTSPPWSAPGGKEAYSGHLLLQLTGGAQWISAGRPW